jgi:hypothetical protein
MHVTSGLGQLSGGRLHMTPRASASPGLHVDAATGHTGNLMRATLNGTDKFTVDPNGNAVAAGAITADNIRASRTSVPAPGTGGGTSTAAVIFSNPMANTPRVTLTPESTIDPATVTIRAYVDDVSTAGFTIRCYRSTNSSTNIAWIAVSDPA